MVAELPKRAQLLCIFEKLQKKYILLEKLTHKRYNNRLTRNMIK